MRVRPKRSGWTSPRNPSGTSAPRFNATGVGCFDAAETRPLRGLPAARSADAEASRLACFQELIRDEDKKTAKRASIPSNAARTHMAPTLFAVVRNEPRLVTIPSSERGRSRTGAAQYRIQFSD